MKLMKIKEVMHMTSLARATIYKYMDLGKFPKPVPLGGRAVAWITDEVEEWITQRIAERDESAQNQENVLNQFYS